jgi:predicted GNAT family acetyltransferase
MNKRTFLNNKDKKRYELHVGDYFSLAEYIINNEGVVYITHTETPMELEGQGIASELIEKTLQDIKDQGRKVFPICPFVISYIQKHPEWIEIVK